MYRISEMAELSGVSARALRHYEELGLLRPKREKHNAYRVYTAEDVDRLQQVLFYREMGMPLSEISRLMRSGEYEAGAALRAHLNGLKARRDRLDTLIRTLEKTIMHTRGEINMADREKFEGFKKKLVADNEARYGREARERYGGAAVDAANEKVLGQSPEEFARCEALSNKVNGLLKAAVESGDTGGGAAAELVAAHREWLMCYWARYDRNAHRSLGGMYVADERFKAYYEAVVPGGAAFLRGALEAILK